jgi:hypothetical protein
MNNYQPINNGESLQSARTKINNIGTNALGPEHNTDTAAHGTTVVKTVSQTLTAAQQSRARANIGAASTSDIVAGAVRYDASQALTDAQKAQARANIGAITAGEIPSAEFNYVVSDLSAFNATTPSETIDAAIGGFGNLSAATAAGKTVIMQYGGIGYCSLLYDRTPVINPIRLYRVWGSSYNGTVTVMEILNTSGTLSFTKQDIPLSGGGSSIDPATTESYGSVILGYGYGDYRDAGRVATMDEEGKIPTANLRDAYSNPDTGGVVKVTLNGGTQDAGKVPIVSTDGRLSFMVLPSADTQMQGAVTLASNTGNSTDLGKVPVLNEYGQVNAAVIPGMAGYKERRFVTMSPSLTIPENDPYDIYDMLIDFQGTPANVAIYPPYSQYETRGKIKIRIQCLNSPGGPAHEIYPLQGYAPVSLPPLTQDNLFIYCVVLERLSTKMWAVTFKDRIPVPDQLTFIDING